MSLYFTFFTRLVYIFLSVHCLLVVTLQISLAVLNQGLHWVTSSATHLFLPIVKEQPVAFH